MKYGDKIIRMEGIIVEVHDGSVTLQNSKTKCTAKTIRRINTK